MTVGELIEKLEKYPKDKEVRIWDEYRQTHREITSINIADYPAGFIRKPFVEIDFQFAWFDPL
jgi:hypothetical protein